MVARFGVWYELLARFWRICLFQAGPQDLPASALLLLGLMVLNIATGTLAIVPMTPIGSAVLEAALGPLLLAVCLDGLLRLYALRVRFLQAMSALIGTEIYFNLLVAGIAWSVDWSDKTQTMDSSVVLLWMILVIWSAAVRVVILRSTLNCLTSVSIFYLLMFGLISWQLAAWLVNYT